jgi:hypothetical protein
VLALMVYQLGACPCGCLEHNAWLQWAGITADHYGGAVASTPAAESLITTADGDYHDCTGEPRPQFVDNARSARHMGDFFASLATVVYILNASVDDTATVHGRFERGSDSASLAHALSRPALQVYRL